MKKNFLLLSLIFFQALGTLGCRSGGESSNSPSPYVDFECNAADSPSCTEAADSSIVYIGLTAEANFDCETELLNLSPQLFIPSFTYSGFTYARFNGSFLAGVVTEWLNSSGGQAQTMPNTDYKACAFLDLNNNGTLDYYEPIATDTINPSEDFYPLSQWYHP